MSTSLSAIANAGFDFENIESELERVVSALKKISWNIEKTQPTDAAPVEPQYYLDLVPEYEVNKLEINFMHEFVPTFYQDAVEISIGFSYETIYRLHDIGLLEDIRKDLFTICQSIGATEVFFVADVDKLRTIQEYLATGWSYQQLKDEAIKMLGEPLSDYSKLNYCTLDYQNITEFVLDDFQDLKR
jgi:hypothetical protein